MPSPNVHLEHIEDEIFNSGIEGGRASINFIRSLRDMLVSGSKRSVNVTVKWDGAPAIFCGNDPETGKFFVAKKSLFNKTPKFYTSIAEIDADLDGQLADKFKACYNNLKNIGIKNILQGDLMFTKGDLAKQDINGESYETFQPNTIMYAVPSTSKLASTMRAAQVGIVFHTTYTGDSLMNLKATFGANIKGLKKTSKVWMDDAEYNDVSGTATFTQKDSAEITRLMSRTGKVFQKIKAPQLKKFLDMQNKIDAGLTYKTYHNSKVREGTNFLRLNYKKHADEYLKFVEDKMDTQIGKLKSDSAKKTKEKNKNILLTEVRKNLLLLKTLVEFQALINYAKIKILTKVNKASQMTAMFVKKGNGFDVVAPEGFVAIDNNLGGAVKLVDRMEFSLNNFTVQKDWDK